MRKILVLIPHGEVYERDRVRAYRWRDVVGNLDRYYNMGDLFVYDSSLKLLEFDYVEPLIVDRVSERDIDRYNAEFEYCFLRGSNYLHPDMDWEHAAEVLSRLKIPVVPFGIGAQSPDCGPPALSADTIRVMRLIADRCEKVGVRGAFTAETLKGIGVANVEIIGCPTLFRARDPELAVRLRPLADVQAVGFGLRREAAPHYTSDPARYLAVQRLILEAMDRRFSLTILAQGELEEKQIFYRSVTHLPDAIHNLIASGWFANGRDPLYATYRNQLFFSECVADYEALMQRLDLVVTFRLHAALLALANGTPAVFCTYDSRSRELAETYAIPSYDTTADVPFDLDALYGAEQFTAFGRAYHAFYARMRAFLDINGMAHRL